MQDELINKVANLMTEQTDAYNRLQRTTNELQTALINSELIKIEKLTREGESELLWMRSRLLEITSELTKFAEYRATQNEKRPLAPNIREAFDTSAKNLLEIAKEFKSLTSRAAGLALGGSSFATACIQVCGVPASTYRKPVLKNYEGKN